MINDFTQESANALSWIGDLIIPGSMNVAVTFYGMDMPSYSNLEGRFGRPFDAHLRDKLVSSGVYIMSNSHLNIPLSHIGQEESTFLVIKPSLRPSELMVQLDTLWSSHLSLQLGEIATFKCKVTLLPSSRIASDFFGWKLSMEEEQALNAYCLWVLKPTSKERMKTKELLEYKAFTERLTILSSHGINFKKTPQWERQGVVLLKRHQIVNGLNPAYIEIGYDFNIIDVQNTIFRITEKKKKYNSDY